ncbi:hypothetical protein BH11PSE12_BH11PSE12_06140 [soil metagenome]
MTPRHLALGAALLAAAGFAVFGDKTPNSAVAEAVVRIPASATVAVPANTANTANTAGITSTSVSSKTRPAPAGIAIERLRARASLILTGPGIASATTGEPVFGQHNWNPPPPPAPPPVAAAKPAPPTAPALPFIYLGKSLSEGHWEVFLSRGERTIIVQNKSVIDGVYRVDTITPPSMMLTYLPLNQVQQLTIGVLD